MPATQVERGKALEFAMIKNLELRLSQNQEVFLERNNELQVAERFYNNISNSLALKMQRATRTAVECLLRFEPQLLYPGANIPLRLRIQSDARGRSGDVRDIVTIRDQNNWEIGISCKHNNRAVKHSRLSRRNNFGLKWFGYSCSDQYFSDIEPVFLRLRELARAHVLWEEIPDKHEHIYRPILVAFISELSRISAVYSDTPSKLLQYLIGRNDFYKMITKDSEETTTIQAFNMSGSLNRSAENINAQTRVALLPLPTRFLEIDFKENSNTTIIVSCDRGWSVSMRIHNGSGAVEASVKFDVNLIGVPTTLFSHTQSWDE